MNIIKKFVIVFFSGLALLFIISLVLPSEYSIKREISLNCSNEQVYEYLSNINNVDKWFYISKNLDSTLKYKFNIDSLNNKSSFSWNGDILGNGKFYYTNFKISELIEYKISYEDDKVVQNGKFLIENKTNKINLAWIEYGENGFNPINRIFGLFIDSFLGPDMEKSLEKIKSNLGC